MAKAKKKAARKPAGKKKAGKRVVKTKGASSRGVKRKAPVKRVKASRSVIGKVVDDVKFELLKAGCSWRDIVTKSERPKFESWRDKLDERERDKNPYAVLEHDLPLLQCLVFQREDKTGAALVGWMFAGSTDARVYFSEDRDTVDFFYGYCHHLFLNVAKTPDRFEQV